MATKDQLYQIIAAYGLGRTLPSGSTRKAARAAANTIVKSGRIVVPAAGRAAVAASPSVARGGLALARANPAIATASGLLALQQAGLLDPITEPIGDAIQEEIVMPIKKSGKRTRNKFNKAVSAGMKAVKMSTSNGKKGTIRNAKTAFKQVTKIASKVRQGKKTAVKGVAGKIARAVKRFY